MSTTALLYEFKPDVVINTGSAGGYDPSLEVGAIVISDEVRHHDVDVTILIMKWVKYPNYLQLLNPMNG